MNPYTGAYAPNPPMPGQGSPFVFHNGLLDMNPMQTVGVQQPPAGRGELFCAGHRWTRDGRLFVPGGTRVYPPYDDGSLGLPLFRTGALGAWEGARVVYQWVPPALFSTSFGLWVPMDDMDAERWYPTVIFDGNFGSNRYLILGGTDILPSTGIFDFVNTYESYVTDFNVNPPVATFEQKTPPGTFLRQYNGINIDVPGVVMPGTTSSMWPCFTEYPRAHAIAVGTGVELFVSGYVGRGVRWIHTPPSDPVYALNMGTEAQPSVIVYSTNLLWPAAVGAIPNRVGRIGGARYDATSPMNPPATVTAPTNRVETVTVPTGASSQWSSGGSSDILNMLRKRFWGNVVILPTGDLFAVGGSDFVQSHLVPEVYSVSTGTWSDAAASTSPRNYHACAVLLPDGRVLVCGGEGRTSDYEIWVPNYLLGPANRRPAGINVVNAATGVPINPNLIGAATWGQACRVSWTNTLPAGVEVTQVVLMAPASLTHHDDGGQRLARLTLSAPEEVPNQNSLDFLMPATHRHAPQGWYMLFAITNEGVPAHAFWVNLQ